MLPPDAEALERANCDVIRDYFEAANRREFDTVMAVYADDVVMVIPADWLVGGTFEGKEAVGRWFGDWYRTFDGGPHFEPLRIEGVGDAVVLSAQARSRGGMSGVELESTYHYVFRLREGKIAHLQFYGDWAQALAAAEK